MTALPLVIAVLAASPPGQPSSEPAASTVASKESGYDVIAVPLVNFNSDQGFGYGAAGGTYIYGPGYRPYRHALGAQVFFSSAGVQNHFVRYDGPHLLGPARVEARLEFRRELLAPFYGPGNLSAPEMKDPTDRLYTYERVSPGGWVRLRGRPLGDAHPLEAYVTYGFRRTEVITSEGSLLGALRPRGTKGGSTGQLAAGVLWDVRDDEADPTRGGLWELGVRVADPMTGSRYRFAGVTAGWRGFWSVVPGRVVVAQRLTFDHLMGDVPFFEWPNLGGMNPSEGIGGMSTVRGVPRNRYAGATKAVSNSEVRVNAFQFNLLRAPVRVGALALLDLGRAWHPGVDDGAWYRWHPGVGAGLRLTRRAAVVRFDYALAPETGRQGVYVTFGHMF